MTPRLRPRRPGPTSRLIETNPSCWCSPGATAHPYETPRSDFGASSNRKRSTATQCSGRIRGCGPPRPRGVLRSLCRLDECVGSIVALSTKPASPMTPSWSSPPTTATCSIARRNPQAAALGRVRPGSLRGGVAEGLAVRPKAYSPFNTPDIMPTLLACAASRFPRRWTAKTLGMARGRQPDADRAALISCVTPFGEWIRRKGGREYRGIRTARYTYVRSLQGPWLLYDNQEDPTSSVT